jgi:hypothetical protein
LQLPCEIDGRYRRGKSRRRHQVGQRPNDNNAVALVAGLMGRRPRKVPKRTAIPCRRCRPHLPRAQKCRSLTRTDGALL